MTPDNMDTSLLTFELKEKYLLVIGQGQRNNLASMNEASSSIYEKVMETKMKLLLVDYRKLEINVHLNEAFNIVKRYETTLIELKNIKIAAVFSTRGLEFGTYWRDVSRQRGFMIEIFEDLEVARKWLFQKS
jgi:hypothetical protein